MAGNPRRKRSVRLTDPEVYRQMSSEEHWAAIRADLRLQLVRLTLLYGAVIVAAYAVLDLLFG